jgi:hypothetical protein
MVLPGLMVYVTLKHLSKVNVVGRFFPQMFIFYLIVVGHIWSLTIDNDELQLRPLIDKSR